MSLWRHFTRGIRKLVNATAAEQDLADELQDYLDRATNEHLTRGLSPHAARRAARLEVGSLSSATQQAREYGWEHRLDSFLADLRYAARRLAKAPGFTTVAVLTLGLGVGAATAIFSALKPVLLDPLPYPEADRITTIWELRRDGVRADGSFGMYRALADRSQSFEALAVLKPWQPTLTGHDRPERLDGQRVSASYFQVLGVSPILGRPFDPAEDQPGGLAVVVLSHALWQRHFGGDPGIVGRHTTLDGNPYEIIGVMPHDFENALAPTADVWAPMQYGMAQGRAWGHHLNTVGRLRPGVTRAQAVRELDALGQAVLDEQRPSTYASSVHFLATSLQDDVSRDVRPALLICLGAVMLVLAVACVNVTGLLLGRGAERRAEFALRAALGAGRGRMIRQMLTESLLLSALGGGAGVIIALLGVQTLVALSPPDLPRAAAITIDREVFLFAVVITTLVGIAVGLIPALQAARPLPHASLPQGTARTTGRQRTTRRALVVAEVSLAVVLLVCSGLLWRSLDRLLGVRVGFDSASLLTIQVPTSGPRFRESGTTQRFFSQALDAVRAVPGVTAAALTSQLPLSGDLDLYGVHFDPAPPDDPGEVSGTLRYSVSPGYIETMRIPVVRGRSFDDRDRENTPRVVLVSESLAKRRLAGVDPIGQRLRIGPADGPLYTVVGVVGDVKQRSLASDESEAVYTTEAQWRFPDTVMSMVIRASSISGALVPAVRDAVWSVDSNQPVVGTATMDDLVSRTAAVRRFLLIVVEAFACAALVLAAAGIYGVLAGSVTERTREIGIRAALGASRRDILGLVVREGLLLTGFGTAIGFIAAVASTQALATMLFGVSRVDPITYVGVILLMAVAAIVACWTPGWRAVRLDPARTLRSE